MLKGIGSNLNVVSKEFKFDEPEVKTQESFTDFFKKSLQDVNQLQKNADTISEQFALGNVENLHDVTIATEKAQITLNLTATIQNKVIEAYKEIMRLQI